MLRKLLVAIARALVVEPAHRPAPASVGHLKRMAEQLNEKATRFRHVASRLVMLEQRVEIIETDSAAWERRARSVPSDNAELTASVQRICGRFEGQLQEAQAELALLRADGLHLRALLTDGRKEFVRLVELARGLGHDVSGCLLYIDLTRPDRVADETLLVDEDRDFVARVIDARLH